MEIKSKFKIFSSLGLLIAVCLLALHYQNCASDYNPKAYDGDNSGSSNTTPFSITTLNISSSTYLKNTALAASGMIISDDPSITCAWSIKDSVGNVMSSSSSSANAGNCVSSLMTPNSVGGFSLNLHAFNSLSESATSVVNFVTTEPPPPPPPTPGPTPTPTPTPLPPALTVAVSLMPTSTVVNMGGTTTLKATIVANINADMTVAFGTVSGAGVMSPLANCSFTLLGAMTFSPTCSVTLNTVGTNKFYVQVSAGGSLTNCLSAAGTCSGTYAVTVLPFGS